MKIRLMSIGAHLLALLCAASICVGAAPREVRTKSVTVYPIIITPSKNIAASIPGRIAEVVGMFLERANMEQVELGEATFSPHDSDNLSQIAAGFGQFVTKQPLKTEYALFGQFMGTPATGPQEIRTVVVDKTGAVVFADQADKQALSHSKIKPDCPLECSLFLVDRLGKVWDLEDPMRAGAPEGKLAEVLKRRSGLPAEETVAAMNKRLAAAKATFAASTVTVYPIHLWTDWDNSGAAQLAKLLNEQSIGRAQTTETEPQLTIAGDPNEQKILWDTARSFREFIQTHPPDTQFALLADYGLSPSSDGSHSANHVHLILCNRTGDWVMVDFQNSHQPDFRSIDPRTVDGANRLAVMRLKSRISE